MTYRVSSRLLLATAMLATATAVHAQAAHEVPFNVPPQDLDSALTSIADQGGIHIFFTSADLAGRHTGSIAGRMTVEQALSRALAGSGYGWRYREAGTVVIEKLPETQGAIQLGPVRVEGQATSDTPDSLADQRAHENPAGPVAGYVASRSVTATKTDTPLIETARTVTVVTRDQMDAQQAQSLRDTLRYAPGIYYSDDADFRFEPVYARGFELDQYLDGLSLLAGTWAVPRIDPYFLERSEVLEGPASTLYGQGAPGGLLDMVSKQPTATPLHEIEVQTGSYGRAQAAVDLSGPLDQDGHLLYRLTGLFRDTGTQVNYVRQERIEIAPSLTWRPDSDTSLTLSGSYLRDPKAGFWNLLPYEGTILPNKYGTIPRNFYVGDPSFEKYTFNQAMAGYQFDHRFSDAIAFRQNFRFTHIDLDYREVQGYSFEADQRTLDRYAYTADESLNTETLDNQLEVKVATGKLSHKILLGLDYQHFDWNDLTRWGYTAPTLDLLDPDYNQTIGLPPIFQNQHEVMNRTGLYAQDQMRFDHFVFTIGGRQNWADQDTFSRITNTHTRQSDSAFTWHTDLLYHFDSGFAPYFSYATSFQPVIGTDAEGNPFKPTRGKQEEIGLKYQPNGWNAYFTASAFNLVQSNVQTADPNNANYEVQTGQVRSRGIELSAVASLTSSLSIRASYTYLDNRITQANDDTLGKTLLNTPRNFASLWGDYTIRKGPLSGIGFSAGGRYVGETYASNEDIYTIPDYFLFDAAVHYDLGYLAPKLQGWMLRVNVNNLADKQYVSYCTGFGCRWGEGRTIYASLRYRW
jgi:iron complex outermembrane recepter protein